MESTVAINPMLDQTISGTHITGRALLLAKTRFFSLQCVIADLCEQQGRS